MFLLLHFNFLMHLILFFMTLKKIKSVDMTVLPCYLPISFLCAGMEKQFNQPTQFPLKKTIKQPTYFFPAPIFLFLVLHFSVVLFWVILKAASKWAQTTELALFDITYRKYDENFDNILVSIRPFSIAGESCNVMKPKAETIYVVKWRK